MVQLVLLKFFYFIQTFYSNLSEVAKEGQHAILNNFNPSSKILLKKGIYGSSVLYRFRNLFYQILVTF